ncbi:MAG: (deoxy)nucleoside triphosphate pyrophosphohydrolase [Erysipelotrichaceae bacterium]|nr:(deoxy)nucleoside triphosphate pyrophosphohydrolase [Erysipelotrichaceae bacterium]
MKTIRVVAAVIEKEDKILIARRLKGQFAGLWEFPGGKYEEGETGEQAIKREIEEEFDVEIDVKKYLCTIEHQYDSFYLVMDCYICNLLSDKMVLHDHSGIRWIHPQDTGIDWVPADTKVINNYNEHLQKGN